MLTKKNKLFYLLLLFFILNQRKINIKDYKNDKVFISEIKKEFKKNLKVNLNNIEKKIMNEGNFNNHFKQNVGKIKNIINIGFTLDPGFIYQTMLTATSILANQRLTTKVVFHFGVVKNFTPVHMLKIYSLKNNIKNLSEFNFYYLKKSMIKMKNFHRKGEACPGKFELPELLPDNVSNLFSFFLTL